MSCKVEKYNKLAELSSNHFLTASSELQVKNLWLRTKTKANLKPEF